MCSHKLRLTLVVALAVGLLGASTAANAAAAAAKPTPAVRTTCSTAAFANNKLLGPKRLPNAGPVACLLRGWQRLAGFSPRGYLKLFYDKVPRAGATRRRAAMSSPRLACRSSVRPRSSTAS